MFRLIVREPITLEGTNYLPLPASCSDMTYSLYLNFSLLNISFNV